MPICHLLAMGIEAFLYREYLEEEGQGQNSLITARRKPNKEWTEVTRRDQAGTCIAAKEGTFQERYILQP